MIETVDIPLTHGKVAIVDAADGPAVLKFKWHAVKGKAGNWYAYRHRGNKNRLKHEGALHRFLMNPPPGTQVDHKDGNGLNCRRYNMRIATNQQNSQNQKVRDHGHYKGVQKYSHANRWRAYIKHNRKPIYLGCFKTPEEAARAYDAKAIELFGEFAKLNIPQMEVV